MNKRLQRTVAIGAILTLLTLLTVFLVFSSTTQRAIAGSGVLTYGALDVYWDETCVDKVVAIDWGVLTPGETKPVTVYVRNEGTEPLTVTVTTSDWNPVTEYISFYAANFTLPVDAILPREWSVTIAEDIRLIKSFAFNITVWG